MPNNPIEIKNQTVSSALKRLTSDDPINIISELGDPMIPVIAGILSESSKITHVILAGGTQMTAVLAFAKKIGYNKKNVAIGCTSYLIVDIDAKFLETVKQIDDIPVLSVDPLLNNSNFAGLRSYSEGFVKEGAGAGGCMIAALLKTKITSQKLLELIEKELILALNQLDECISKIDNAPMSNGSNSSSASANSYGESSNQSSASMNNSGESLEPNSNSDASSNQTNTSIESSADLEDQGKNVYKFGFGQSPFPVPETVIDELKKYANEKAYLPVEGLYPLREARENFEKEYLTTQLKKFGGNISKTAKFVGMERSALHRKLKSLGIKGIN